MNELWVLTERDINDEVVSQKFFHKLENALKEAEMITQYIIENQYAGESIDFPTLERRKEGNYFAYNIGSYAESVEVELFQFSDYN